MITVVGSLILAIGALFGIWLGAYYAGGRLAAQLDQQAHWFVERRGEEAGRFERQLEMESKRLERQLEHDRRMRDREELRSVLDDVGRHILKAINAVLEARVLVPVLGNRPAGHDESPKERQNRRERALTARKKIYELTFEVQRLRLRFGLDHPVTDAFNAVHSALEEHLDSFDVEEENWTDEQRKLVEEKLRSVGDSNTAFVNACRHYTDVEAV